MIKRKSRFKYIIVIIFGILCLIGIVYSIYNIYSWNKDTSDNKNIKEVIDKSINVRIEEEQIKYDIDWKTLKEQNSDTVAYIKINNTNIDYVVVKSNDNNYYLKHNFNKEYNVAGWIFADYHNKFDGTDKNIIVYGHNIKDGSMFGSLKKILEESWYNNENNLLLDLVMENESRKYRVFSIYTITAEDYYINTNFDNDDEYIKFLNTLKNRSINNFNIELTSDDQILTLSTCVDGGIKRVVLHAVLKK